MHNTRDPILKPVPIMSLRPTQMTVGLREVKEKRKRWREHKSEKKRAELLGKHMIPVVLGPDGHNYVVDHHHLARALHDEGVENVLVTVIGDLTMEAKLNVRSIILGCARLTVALAGCAVALAGIAGMALAASPDQAPPIPSGQALTWFLRQLIPGTAMHAPMIFANGEPLAIIPQGVTFYRDVAPGTYSFAIQSCLRQSRPR